MNEKKYNSLMQELKSMEGKPLTANEAVYLQGILKAVSKPLGISEHFKWCFEVVADKYTSMADKLAGAKPYETVCAKQNIVLDNGRGEIASLIVGSGTAYNNTNAKIYVGDNATAENSAQTGVLATTNVAYTSMTSGYPTTSGGTVTFQGTLGDSVGNFEIQEIAITNGTGVGAVALNRRVVDLGRKASGTTWEITATITLLSV